MSNDSPRPVRVAVRNDFEIVVAGVAAVLAPFADRVEVVELDVKVPPVQPVDVLLYDTFSQEQGSQMQVTDLVEGDTKLLVFSWNTDHELVEQARRAGAHGYVAKTTTPEGLVEAIEAVHRGDWTGPDGGDSPHQPDDRPIGRWPGEELGLSARESEVLTLLCRGLSNAEIGERVFIGINTVKTHLRTLYRKIDVTSRTQAVLWGHDHGFDNDDPRQSLGPQEV